MANSKAPVVKKIPTRRCTGCGEHFPKSTLIRVVRSPEGEISLDKTGKNSGRGAYICPDVSCYEKALKSKRLERTLEVEIPDSVYEQVKNNLVSEE